MKSMLYTPEVDELTATVATNAAPSENPMNAFLVSLVSFCRRSFFSYSVNSLSSASSSSVPFPLFFAPLRRLLTRFFVLILDEDDYIESGDDASTRKSAGGDNTAS